MKRILPWEDDDWNWSVRTRCGDLSVVRDDEHNEWLAKWIYVDDDDTIGRYPDAESAIDACESAYLARCTEFLKLAGPGEVVVSVKDAADAATFMLAAKKGAGIVRDGMLVTPDCIRARLSAAIDAARGSDGTR